MIARVFVPLAMRAFEDGVPRSPGHQAVFYDLAKATGNLEGLGYSNSWGRSYSNDVEEAMDWLTIIGALHEVRTSLNGVDGAGVAVRLGGCFLGPEGRKFVASTAREHPDAWKAIKAEADRMKVEALTPLFRLIMSHSGDDSP